MKKVLLAAVLALLPTGARALVGCQNTTGPLVLEKIRSGATGSEIWGCVNRSFDLLSSSAAVASASTSTINKFGIIYVSEIGGRDTGSLHIKLSSSVWSTRSDIYFLWSGSMSVTGAPGLHVQYGVLVGTLTVASSATVQGNAFSVGATTFAVIGSSVGVRTAAPAYAFQVVNGDVDVTSGTYRRNGLAGVNKSCPSGQAATGQYFTGGILADGGSCAALGSGDMVKAADNDVTGTIDMQLSSTFTVVPASTVETTTIAVSGTYVTANGFETILVSTTAALAGVKAFIFDVSAIAFTTATRLTISYNISVTAAAEFAIRLNGDAGSNYVTAYHYGASNTGAAADGGTLTRCLLTPQANTLKANESAEGYVTLTYSPINRRVRVRGHNSWQRASDDLVFSGTTGCQFASTLTQLTHVALFMNPASAAFVGNVKLKLEN